MSEQRAYVRVYWTIIDDPKFSEVYDDDRALACWLRLLISADQAWPASASVAASVRRPSLDKLVRVGLVDLVAGGRYRIHGLDAERNARQDAARNAAAMRWQSTRNAGASDTRMPNRAEPSKAEPSRAEDDGRADLEAFLEVRFRPPTEAQRTFMDGYVRTFDLTGPERAARLILANPADPIGALKRDLAEFRDKRAAEARASEVPKPKARPAGTSALVTSAHNFGQHADNPLAECPYCQRMEALA